jgi:hypothetical protein
MVISLLFAAGHTLLGIATYHAGALPRRVGALLAAGALSMLVFEQIGAIFLGTDALWAVGPVMLGAAFAWLGYSLLSDTPDAGRERQIERRRAPVGLAADAR